MAAPTVPSQSSLSAGLASVRVSLLSAVQRRWGLHSSRHGCQAAGFCVMHVRGGILAGHWAPAGRCCAAPHGMAAYLQGS